MKVIFKELDNNVEKPKYSHINDAGADFKIDRDIVIKPGSNVIPLNFECIIPPGHAAFLCLRSSWMAKGILTNIVPIDADYSGNWHFSMYNVTDKDINVTKGERFGQIMILPVVQGEFISEEEYNQCKRGSNGLGSTGK